jgi:putative methylase
MRRRDLEMALEAVPAHPDPVPEREQYRTPAPIAADLLWAAWTDGAIAGKRVLDLGCGTGMFAIGAALLGADAVLGVDVDSASLDLARQAAAKMAASDLAGRAGPAGQAEWADRITWAQSDLADWHPDGPFDTVVMNPPFGAQKGNRGGDRLFYDRAAEAVQDSGGSAWFLAQARTERFLAAYARELGGRLEKVAQWDYPIMAQFAFHDKPVHAIQVGGYRLGFE